MAFKATVQKIGDALGIVLPKAIIDRLGIEAGDTLVLTHMPGGVLCIAASRPEFTELMRIAERGMRDYHGALRQLH